MLLSNSPAWNEPKKASLWFRKPMVVEIFIHGSVRNVMYENSKPRSIVDKCFNAVVMRAVHIISFLLLASRCAKQHADATMVRCSLTQLYLETGKVDKTGNSLLPNRWISDVIERSGIKIKYQTSKKRIENYDKRLSRESRSPGKSTLSTFSSSMSKQRARFHWICVEAK